MVLRGHVHVSCVCQETFLSGNFQGTYHFFWTFTAAGIYELFGGSKWPFKTVSHQPAAYLVAEVKGAQLSHPWKIQVSLHSCQVCGFGRASWKGHRTKVFTVHPIQWKRSAARGNKKQTTLVRWHPQKALKGADASKYHWYNCRLSIMMMKHKFPNF